jgi:hypothetical protein
MLFICFIITLFLLLAEIVEARLPHDMTDEQRLLHKLRQNYDPSVRPVYDAKRPVIINLGITLTQIIDVVR